MQRMLPWLALLGCLALPWSLWSTMQPRSDDVLMRHFAAQRSVLAQLVGDAQRDSVPFFIGSWVTLWPEDLTKQGVTADRIAQYRGQLRQAGVTSISSDDDGSTVSFHTNTALLGSVKSFLYSPMRPSAVTDGSTDNYRFAPGQFQVVCRPLEDDWYLCLDHED